MIELISILILTFSLTLVLLGLITLWLEKKLSRWSGIALIALGVLVGAGYSFLGSRFSLLLFDRLVVRVNLPALMATAFGYTIGVLGGAALAFGMFLWVSGRYQVWQIRRRVIALISAVVLLAVTITFMAMWLSRLPH
ncbi:MAG: hypothetical protein JXD18_08395 [Anaerolineae bacterium]|nr:hypothetical protein [Anaerolineae bacterium]